MAEFLQQSALHESGGSPSIKEANLGIAPESRAILKLSILSFLFADNRLAISPGTDAPVLAREVIDYAEWIFDIAARKIRLVLDNFTALLY